MKKIFFSLILLSFSMIAVAQSNFVNRAKFGVQASPTYSWLKTTDTKIKGNGQNLGFKLGVTLDYFFSENYAITSGLGFAFNQGGKLAHETGGNFLTKSTLSDSRLNKGLKPLSNNVNIRYHVQYLEVPIGLKLRTQQFGYLRYYAEAPMFTVGVKTQGKGDIYDDAYTESPFLKENIKEDVGLFNFSWGFGAGVNYDISPSTSAVAGIYFQKGMLDVTRDGNAQKALTPSDPAPVDENSKATLGVVTLRVGIIF
jgi:hypothetical protein